MEKEKSPAYQWYPKDILTDKRVIPMSNETENMYRRLLDYAWLEDGLDNNLALMASYAKLPGKVEKFKKFWKEIKKCWYLDGEKWRNSRQELERAKQKLFSEKQRKAANARWGTPSHGNAGEDATASDRHCQPGNALQSSSSFSSSSSLKDRSSDLLNFDEDQMQLLKTEIAKSMKHGLFSEANVQLTKELLEKVKKYIRKNKVENVFAYALTSARNLNKAMPGMKK